MSRKKRKKQETPENGVELLNQLKEETEVKEKMNIFKKIGGGIKGFFGSTAGKVVTVITMVGAAGAIIYKVVFADGHEEYIEADQMDSNVDTQYHDVELDSDSSEETTEE